MLLRPSWLAVPGLITLAACGDNAVSPAATPDAPEVTATFITPIADERECADGEMYDYSAGECVATTPEEDGRDSGGGGGSGTEEEAELPDPLAEPMSDVVPQELWPRPDCEKPQDNQIVAQWCKSLPPSFELMREIEKALEDIVERCESLQHSWDRVKSGGVRIFTAYPRQGFWGGAVPSRLAQWMLISTNAIDAYGLSDHLAHELLHLQGLTHETPEELTRFNEAKAECAGPAAVG